MEAFLRGMLFRDGGFFEGGLFERRLIWEVGFIERKAYLKGCVEQGPK